MGLAKQAHGTEQPFVATKLGARCRQTTATGAPLATATPVFGRSTLVGGEQPMDSSSTPGVRVRRREGGELRQVMAKDPVIFNARVTYKGIQMRSDLEAKYAGKLDMAGRTWRYEPERFYSKAETYLPDFWVQMADGADCYVELKGAHPTDLPAIKKRMEIVWETKPDAFLCLIIAQDSRMWGAHGDDRRWRQG